MDLSSEVVAQLQQYTACDISDALLKLKVPGAGFIPDLNLYAGSGAQDSPVVVAPISTVLFVRKGESPAEPPPNIPKDVHWSDQTLPETFVVLKQPEGQKNAICGGIMALRMMVGD